MPSTPRQVDNCGLPPLEEKSVLRQRLPTELSTSDHLMISYMPSTPRQVHNCGLLLLEEKSAPRQRLLTESSMSAHSIVTCTPSILRQVHNCGLPLREEKSIHHQRWPTELSTSDHMTASYMHSTYLIRTRPLECFSCDILTVGEESMVGVEVFVRVGVGV